MAMTVLLAVVAIIVVFLIFVASRPDTFGLSRSAMMNAPPAIVFAQVNDFHNWNAWSPWAKIDLNTVTNYEGSVEGKGAIFIWASKNPKVGEGKMTITNSHPAQSVRLRLDFIKPFAGTSTAEFSFVPQGQQTKVTWSMEGKNNFVGKLMGIFMNCEKMVGDMYDQGLANIKSIVETH